MIKIETAHFGTLQQTLEGSRHVSICTPFFTAESLEKLRHTVTHAHSIDILVRGNIYDWASGHADLEHLAGFIASLSEDKVEVDLRVRANLHAKIYASKDCGRAYFGSANLTRAAFSTNFEIMAFVDGDLARDVLTLLETSRTTSVRLSIQDFETLVQVCRESVESVRSRMDSTAIGEDNDFATAVELFSDTIQSRTSEFRGAIPGRADGLLTDGSGGFGGLDSNWPSIEGFIKYCRSLRTEEARDIVNRYEGQSNLQGHIKHMFFGCLMYFHENKGAIDNIPHDLLERHRVIWSEEDWVDGWISFINDHATEFYSEISFSFHSLITYLPISLGGVQQSGGASSGNFKKVIFLLAKMLREEIL